MILISFMHFGPWFLADDQMAEIRCSFFSTGSKIDNLNFFFCWKYSVDFWRTKLPLKVQFRHFMTNHNSLQDCFKKNPLSLLILEKKSYILNRTHHIYNSATELTLMYALLNYLSRNQKNDNSILHCCNLNLKKSF